MDKALEEMYPSRPASRVGAAAVVLLIAALVLGTMWVFLAPAGADAQLAGKRDDDGRELVAVEDDDDDDHDPLARRGASITGNGANGGTGNSGEPSIGTNSANTATGTTQGTGPSRTVSNSSDRSANTATGTTQGTGPSRTVSNSS